MIHLTYTGYEACFEAECFGGGQADDDPCLQAFEDRDVRSAEEGRR
jgi:hypothetical protein